MRNRPTPVLLRNRSRAVPSRAPTPESPRPAAAAIPAAVARVDELRGLRAPSLKPDSTVPSLLRLLEVRLLPSVPVPLVPGEVLLASGLVPLDGPSPPFRSGGRLG